MACRDLRTCPFEIKARSCWTLPGSGERLLLEQMERLFSQRFRRTFVAKMSRCYWMLLDTNSLTLILKLAWLVGVLTLRSAESPAGSPGMFMTTKRTQLYKRPLRSES